MHIRFGVDPQLLNQLDPLAHVWRVVILDAPIEKCRSSRIGRLRRPHDDALLVDPNARRHIDDAEIDIEAMRLVNQRWMARTRALDPRTRGGSAAGVERDRNELEALWSQLFANFLPDWQVMPAASPGGPCQKQHLSSAQGAELEWFALCVREHQVRCLGGVAHLAGGWRTEGPQFGPGLVQ
jgi:hypothetical protein